MARHLATGLADLDSGALRALIGTRAFTSGLLAIATTTSKVKTVTNTISYCIGGVMYEKAATDNLFVHTDTTVQAADTTKYYGLFLDKDGAASIVQGTSTKLPEYDPALYCMVGYIKVVTVAVTFTPGTTAHNAAGVTTTYVNLSVPPISLT